MKHLFAPVLVQFAMTMGLLLATGLSRALAIRSRQVRIKDVALGQNAWPPRVTQIGNSFHNQLEMPVFFMLAIVFAFFTRDDSTLTLGLAWAYVALRIVHMLIHVTSNIVPVRFAVFALSNMVLAAMWIRAAVRFYS